MKVSLLLFLILHQISHGQMLTKESLMNHSYIINGKNTDKFLTSGTGTIVQYEGRHYLVTNYHVLTGKDHISGNKFPEIADTTTAISLIFQPKTSGPFIVIVYPIYDGKSQENFGTCMFKEIRIDLSVMPIILPDNAAEHALQEGDFDSSKYQPGIDLISFGFPKGKFLNGWQPTDFNATSILNTQRRPNIYDPYVFFDEPPTQGTSGFPVYRVDQEGNYKFISVQSNHVDPSDGLHVIKGRSIHSSLALTLIKKMHAENRMSITGDVYQPE